jgi:hypothetical protein
MSDQLSIDSDFNHWTKKSFLERRHPLSASHFFFFQVKKYYPNHIGIIAASPNDISVDAYSIMPDFFNPSSFLILVLEGFAEL